MCAQSGKIMSPHSGSLYTQNATLYASLDSCHYAAFYYVYLLPGCPLVVCMRGVGVGEGEIKRGMRIW